MKPVWLPGINPEAKFNALALLAAVVVFAAGFAGAFMFRAHNTVSVHVKRVERSWGKPDASAPASQVTPLAAQLGLSMCSYYRPKHTLVCH